MALCLLGLTIVLARMEGSGVKVNLFGVQPSEIVKYSIILFLAGFSPQTNALSPNTAVGASVGSFSLLP